MFGDFLADTLTGGLPDVPQAPKDNTMGMVLGNHLQMAQLANVIRMTNMEQNEYMEKRELQKEQEAWAREVIASGRGQEPTPEFRF